MGIADNLFTCSIYCKLNINNGVYLCNQYIQYLDVRVGPYIYKISYVLNIIWFSQIAIRSLLLETVLNSLQYSTNYYMYQKQSDKSLPFHYHVTNLKFRFFRYVVFSFRPSFLKTKYFFAWWCYTVDTNFFHVY